MSSKKEDDKYINLVFVILLIVLVFSFFAINLRLSILKSPPSFNEFYGSMKCGNGVSLDGKLLNITVYGTSNNISSTSTITNSYYSISVQGFDVNSNVIFRINGIQIYSANYIPFSFDERNITVSDIILCPSSTTPPSGGTGGGGGGGGSGGGGGFPPTSSSANITLNVTSNVPSSDVYINGILRGQTPLYLSLETGTYTIKVTKEGYDIYEIRKDIQDSEDINATLNQINTEIAGPIDELKIYFAREPLFMVNLVVILLFVGILGFSYFNIKRTKNKKQ